jgi:hypothetical protein
MQMSLLPLQHCIAPPSLSPMLESSIPLHLWRPPAPPTHIALHFQDINEAYCTLRDSKYEHQPRIILHLYCTSCAAENALDILHEQIYLSVLRSQPLVAEIVAGAAAASHDTCSRESCALRCGDGKGEGGVRAGLYKIIIVLRWRGCLSFCVVTCRGSLCSSGSGGGGRPTGRSENTRGEF